MEIKIQKAGLEHLKDIQRLNLMLFEKEYKEYDKSLNLKWTFGEKGTKEFRDMLTKKNNCGFIAILDEKIVGYLVGGITKAEDYRNLPKVAELDNTLVLEGYRNKGIGTQLYNAFLEWCKNKGVKIIRVQADARNKGAIDFYRRDGFSDYSLTLEAKI